MKLSIFGLGHVGCVSAACFAKAGHEVIGVDVNPLKVEIINSGGSPLVEPLVAELIAEAVAEKRLRATTEGAEAVAQSDVSLVCVGTPSQRNGSLDLVTVKRVCQQIGAALEAKTRYHLVVLRSTLLPGTTANTLVPALEVYSGRRAAQDFGVAFNPEFLREGTSIEDFVDPPFTIIGADDEDSAVLVRRLYAHLRAPVIKMGLKEAEMVKYACNCFHALKVTFANEIGMICKSLGVDSHQVMDVFCQDKKLNLSPCYLKPGFAFGGSCLPKDLRAITHQAKEHDVDVPMLSSILTSNKQQVERTVDLVLQTGRKHVGVLGLSFKPRTDDLRESPMVTLVERLVGKGLKLAIYDREVELARLVGANKEYIEREIPHFPSLMNTNLSEVIERSEVLIIGKLDDEFRAIEQMPNHDRVIIDLVRMSDLARGRPDYQGLCW